MVKSPFQRWKSLFIKATAAQAKPMASTKLKMKKNVFMTFVIF